MAKIEQDDRLPILEQSTDGPHGRLVSYGIYINNHSLYPDYKYVLLKYISFPPSKVIQRDESFAILLNNIDDACKQIAEQGFAVFAKHPSDPPELVCSFM